MARRNFAISSAEAAGGRRSSVGSPVRGRMTKTTTEIPSRTMRDCASRRSRYVFTLESGSSGVCDDHTASALAGETPGRAWRSRGGAPAGLDPREAPGGRRCPECRQREVPGGQAERPVDHGGEQAAGGDQRGCPADEPDACDADASPAAEPGDGDEGAGGVDRHVEGGGRPGGREAPGQRVEGG